MKITKQKNGKLIIDGQGTLVVYKQTDGGHWVQFNGIDSKDVTITNFLATGSPMLDFAPKQSFWSKLFNKFK